MTIVPGRTVAGFTSHREVSQKASRIVPAIQDVSDGSPGWSPCWLESRFRLRFTFACSGAPVRRWPPWSPSRPQWRSEEHTSELQSLMRISYAVFCLKKKTIQIIQHID